MHFEIVRKLKSAERLLTGLKNELEVEDSESLAAVTAREALEQVTAALEDIAAIQSTVKIIPAPKPQ